MKRNDTKGIAVEYTRITIPQFIELVQGGKQVEEEDFQLWIDDGFAYGVKFTDGTAAVIQSDYSGPYSTDTPDIDLEKPIVYSLTKEQVSKREGETNDRTIL